MAIITTADASLLFIVRISLVASRPSITGIIISIRITLISPTPDFSNASTASLPFEAFIISAPAFVRRNSAISMFNSLSSAKRILIPSIDTSSSCLSDCFISAEIRNGSCTMNVVPTFFSLLNLIVPPIFSTSFFVIGIPSPVPP